MAITRIAPPLDYLNAASRSSLQSFELSRLNLAANLRRDIYALMDQWMQETSDALVARWMIEHFGTLHQAAPTAEELMQVLRHPGADPLPEIVEPAKPVAPAPPRFARSRPLMTETLGAK